MWQQDLVSGAAEVTQHVVALVVEQEVLHLGREQQFTPSDQEMEINEDSGATPSEQSVIDNVFCLWRFSPAPSTHRPEALKQQFTTEESELCDVCTLHTGQRVSSFLQ